MVDQHEKRCYMFRMAKQHRGAEPVVTVAIEASVVDRVKKYQDKLGSGELGHVSLRQALASLIRAGLEAKGIP
jgi:uncharacterized protein YceH (UPF0502 family)